MSERRRAPPEPRVTPVGRSVSGATRSAAIAPQPPDSGILGRVALPRRLRPRRNPRRQRRRVRPDSQRHARCPRREPAGRPEGRVRAGEPRRPRNGGCDARGRVRRSRAGGPRVSSTLPRPAHAGRQPLPGCAPGPGGARLCGVLPLVCSNKPQVLCEKVICGPRPRPPVHGGCRWRRGWPARSRTRTIWTRSCCAARPAGSAASSSVTARWTSRARSWRRGTLRAGELWVRLPRWRATAVRCADRGHLRRGAGSRRELSSLAVTHRQAANQPRARGCVEGSLRQFAPGLPFGQNSRPPMLGSAAMERRTCRCHPGSRYELARR